MIVDTTLPHSLDFCSERVSAYTHKAGFCESTRMGRNACQSSFTSSVGAEELVMQKVASLPSGTEDHMLNVVGSASQLDEAVLSSESNYLIESVSQSSDEGVVQMQMKQMVKPRFSCQMIRVSNKTNWWMLQKQKLPVKVHKQRS